MGRDEHQSNTTAKVFCHRVSVRISLNRSGPTEFVYACFYAKLFEINLQFHWVPEAIENYASKCLLNGITTSIIIHKHTDICFDEKGNEMIQRILKKQQKKKEKHVLNENAQQFQSTLYWWSVTFRTETGISIETLNWDTFWYKKSDWHEYTLFKYEIQ